MPLPPRTAAPLAALALLLLTLTGCAGDPWETPREAPAPLGDADPAFVPSPTPAPEATVVPPAGSWGDLRPAPGYRVVLLTDGDDAPTRTIVAAVRGWADEVKADLRTVEADMSEPYVSATTALRMNADLIVIVGEALIDPMAIFSANHLDQHFLVVGAELAEPTHNVTAADWTGASFRGEGLGSASDYDPDTFTPERTGTALRAGVAAVLSGLTGVVIWVD